MRTKRFFVIAVGVILVFVAISISGCSEKLTRRKAANEIKKKYPIDVYTGFLIGEEICDSIDRSRGKEYIELHNAGLIKFQNFGIVRGSCLGSDMFSVELTEKGKQHVREVSYDRSSGYVRVKTCEEVFVEITGIQFYGNYARVEYLYRYDNFTPFGEALEKFYGDKGKSKKRVQCFTLYDDGWRMADF